MNSNIFPCFWMDGTADEAGRFYASVFERMRVESSSPMVTMLETNGQKIMLLNGGPTFKVTPAMSITVMCDRQEQAQDYWNKLMLEGTAMMALDEYPWSKKYGWVLDKYGISWQIYFGEAQAYQQKFIPSLMFIGKNNGRAEEAMKLYTSVFPDSEIDSVLKYPGDAGKDAGNVQHAQLNINDYFLYCMDNAFDHQFNFTEGASISVLTEDQKETDEYWNALTANGGEESRCGWLKDKFGLSWQIVPKRLIQLMNDKDAAKAKRATDAMLQMKKIEIDKLEAAAG